MLVNGHLPVILICVGVCHGYVEFIFPGKRDQNLTFNYIDIVYFTWTSSIDGPWMNLWCAPSPGQPQSKDYLYHEQVPTNGTNAQSFPYSGYNQKGLCHVQIEDFAGDDFANTPVFDITSNDSVEPSTWGLDELGAAGGSPEPTSVQQIQALGSVPSSVLAAATSLPSSSAASVSSFSSSSASSSAITTPTSLESSISASTTSSTPLPQHSSPSQSTSGNASLSPGAKAGISIGSIISVLLVAMLLLLAWNVRLKQRQRPRLETQGRLQEKTQKVAELEGWKMRRYEMDGEGIPNELQGRPKAELIGDTGALERQ